MVEEQIARSDRGCLHAARGGGRFFVVFAISKITSLLDLKVLLYQNAVSFLCVIKSHFPGTPGSF